MAAPQQQVRGTESKYKDYETKIGGIRGHLWAVVHPGAQLEVAGLVIEGEVHHVDWTSGPELGRRRPEHIARVLHYGQTSEVAFGIIVGTDDRK